MRGILTYHSIDASGSPVSVDPAGFRSHVRWLSEGPVRVVPLEEIVSVDAGSDAVAVTFDDALESFGRVAAPLLLEAGIPVTVFVVSDRVGGENDWPGHTGGAVPRLPVLGWDELGRLAEQGVRIGAHTRTHPDLTGRPVEVLHEEMAGSARRIEAEIGVFPSTFAYPYGAHDGPSVEEARRSFDLACTAELDVLPADADPHLLPRLDMFYFRDPARLEAWGSPSFRRHLWMRRAGRTLRSRLSAVGGSRSGGRDRRRKGGAR